MRLATGVLLAVFAAVVALAGCDARRLQADDLAERHEAGDSTETAETGGGDNVSADPDPSDVDVVIAAGDMSYVDPPTEVDAGDLTIALDNEGRTPHDVAVDGRDGPIVEAAGGERAVGQVTLEPGTYTLYCSVPGHRSAGMEFEVTVR